MAGNIVLSDKEKELIRRGKLKAILRWSNRYRTGERFSDGKRVYVIVEVRRWTVSRVAARRYKRDFGCSSINEFKKLITDLYFDYNKVAGDIVSMIRFKIDRQETL